MRTTNSMDLNPFRDTIDELAWSGLISSEELDEFAFDQRYVEAN